MGDVRSIGAGRPLVLLHGFGASGEQLISHGPASALAAQGFRVILPDLRGHGDNVQGPYPPDVLVDDGLELVASLDSYWLGGYSLGARVALRMLVRGARPVAAVIAGQGLDAVTRSPQGGGVRRRALTAMAAGSPLDPDTPEGQQAYWFGQAGVDPRTSLLVLDSLVPTSVSELSQVRTPVLVAAGDADVSGSGLADALPNARFVEVPGNHFTVMGSPALAAAMIDFLG
ncbi:alpha/beta hydrolase [Actinocrispum sp. NPDC049592]|uniref:alpha/beta fold hydrolase n=1 Tax=Actinocrispum sp. NPDC049592 TaxID=3154835 RepID=UPI00342C1A7A